MRTKSKHTLSCCQRRGTLNTESTTNHALDSLFLLFLELAFLFILGFLISTLSALCATLLVCLLRNLPGQLLQVLYLSFHKLRILPCPISRSRECRRRWSISRRRSLSR